MAQFIDDLPDTSQGKFVDDLDTPAPKVQRPIDGNITTDSFGKKVTMEPSKTAGQPKQMTVAPQHGAGGSFELPEDKGPLLKSLDMITEVGSQTLADAAGLFTKMGGGAIKGVTLGAVNPAEGTVGIPFTDKKWSYAPPLDQSLELLDINPNQKYIDTNIAAGGAEMATIAAPWTGASKLLSTGVKALKALRTGKEISTVVRAGEEATKLSKLLGFGERTAEQAGAGAVVGAAEVRNPERQGDYTKEVKQKFEQIESRLSNISTELKKPEVSNQTKVSLVNEYNNLVAAHKELMSGGKRETIPGDSMLQNTLTTAALGAGTQILFEGVGAIANATGLTKSGAYTKLKNDLSDIFFTNGRQKYTRAEADAMADQAIATKLKEEGIKFEDVKASQLRQASKQAKATRAQKEASKKPAPETEAKAETVKEDNVVEAQFDDDLPAETHAELIKQEEIKPRDVEEKGFVISEDKLIPAIKTAEGEIVDADGKKGGEFLSRTQAKNHLKENKPDIHNALAAKLGDDYELHSQDLKKAESLVKAEGIAKSIDEIAPEEKKAEAAAKTGVVVVPREKETTKDFSLKTEDGEAHGNITDTAYDYLDNKDVLGKTINISTMNAKEQGKGQGKNLLATLIEYAKSNNIQNIGSISANKYADNTLKSFEDKGLITPAAKGADGKVIAWRIVENKKQEAKQPWQMTKEEYLKEAQTRYGSSAEAGAAVEKFHKSHVSSALAAGEKVPESVLKDYPDLQKHPLAESAKQNTSVSGVAGEGNLISEARKYKTAEDNLFHEYANLVVETSGGKGFRGNPPPTYESAFSQAQRLHSGDTGKIGWVKNAIDSMKKDIAQKQLKTNIESKSVIATKINEVISEHEKTRPELGSKDSNRYLLELGKWSEEKQKKIEDIPEVKEIVKSVPGMWNVERVAPDGTHILKDHVDYQTARKELIGEGNLNESKRPFSEYVKGDEPEGMFSVGNSLQVTSDDGFVTRLIPKDKAAQDFYSQSKEFIKQIKDSWNKAQEEKGKPAKKTRKEKISKMLPTNTGQNLSTFLQKAGKVKLGEYSDKAGTAWDRAHGKKGKDVSRQLGVIAEVTSKNGKLAMDEAADMANAEGFISRTGKPFTADSLYEELASGGARNILHPDHAERIIERKRQEKENDWIETQLANLEREKVDLSAEKHPQEDILSDIAKEGNLTEEQISAARDEISSFFDEMSAEPRTENTEAGKQVPIPGASAAETFSLNNPETEWSRPLSEQVKPKNADMFAPEEKTGENLQDFGEKIGGARKDTAESGYTKGGKIEKIDDGQPAWKKQFIALEKVDGSGWTLANAKAAKSGMITRETGQVFSSQEEAEKSIPLFAVAQSHRVYESRENKGQWSIFKKIGDRKLFKVVNQEFPSREEGMKYMAEHAEDILNIKTTFGEEILPVPEIAKRTGIERRTADATPELFNETFAPRGIEFGNWNNQEERQQVLNHAYDGLLDLADALNISPKALMLNGDLAIAFGARGQGLSGAKAHYEPEYGVINLTKMKGAGSLAHEWFHAFDHYLARVDTKAGSNKTANKRGDITYPHQSDSHTFQSHGESYKSQLRPEIIKAYKEFMEGMYKKAEKYVEDTKVADKFIAAARGNLATELRGIRRSLEEDHTDWGSYNKKWLKYGKPATPEQLAEFDRLSNILVEGGDLETTFKYNNPEGANAPASKPKGMNRSSYGRLTAHRWSNDTLENINAIIKTVRNRQGFNSERSGVLDQIRANMNLYSARLKMLDDAKNQTEKTKKVTTDYAIEAKKMDQARTGNYWSEPHEMAARAFAAYTEDKIAARGDQSDFLVYHAHGGIFLPMIDGFVARPYPEGKERELITKAFDDFIGKLEEKETDKGVALRYTGNLKKDLPYKLEEATGNADARLSQPITDAGRIQEITDEISGLLGRKIKPEDVSIRDRTSADDLGKVAAAFQKKIVTFQAKNDSLSELPGYFSPKDSKTIFLNIGSAHPHLTVLGHELLHALRHDYPELYNDFSEHLKATDRFTDAKRSTEEIYGGELPEDFALEEYYADYIGAQFIEPRFWEELAEKEPTIFEKMWSALVRLISKLKGLVFNTEGFFTDFEKAEASASDTMAEYARRQGKKASEIFNQNETKRYAGVLNKDIRMKWSDIEGLTDAQKEARNRIERDVKILTANAEEAGQTLPEYLKAIGLDDAKAKRLLDYANAQPVEPPGYREVEPGEELPLGSDVIMDMASGKSFVKVPRETGIKNAVTLEEREKKGYSEVEVEVKRNFGKAFETGKALVDSGQRDPRVLAEEMAKNPRPLSAEESVMLIYDRMRLQNDHHAVMDSIETVIESGDKAAEVEFRAKLAKIEDDIYTNDEAARRTGYEQGLGLAARRMMIKDDYSLARNLQRARVANTGESLTPEIRQQIETLTKQLEAANLKLQKYDEDAAAKAAQRELQKIKNSDVIRKHLSQTKERKAVVRKELDIEFGSLVKNLNQTLGAIHFNFDPSAVKILSQMAKNRVMAGVNSVDDIINEIHSQLKDDYADITKRDIRDAISGYGKSFELSRDEIDVQLREIKRQARLISAYEDALNKEIPLRTGLQRDPVSDKVREMGRKVRQAMREAGIDSQSMKSPEEQWKTSLDAVITRLKNQIVDLTKQLETGEKTPRKIGIKYNEEAEALKVQRDDLKKALEDIEGKPQMSPEQKIKMATAAVEKSILEYERRINEKDLFPQKKSSTTPETPELTGLREKRDHLKGILKDLQNEARPKKTPEEIYKNHLKKRKLDLEEKLNTKNYAKKPRRELNLDPEHQSLRADIEHIKNAIENDIQRIKLANRTKFEKSMDYIVKWRRFVLLSSVKTVGKLTNAAAWRVFIQSPIDDLMGGIWSITPGVSQVMAKAPRHGGGMNVRAEAKAFRQFVEKQTYRDMRDLVTKGKGQLDVLYGKKGDFPPEVLDFFGHLHGALKVTPKRAEFFRSLEKRSQWALKQGVDITDPAVQMTLCADAYNDSNRAILMNKNVINDSYTMLLRYVESKGKAGKAVATGIRVMLPIVRVPTNFALETADYAFGAPKGLAQVIAILIKKDGLKDLTPEQADNIARSLNKGLIGLAILAIGYYSAENIGGYYQLGEKRSATDTKWGAIKIGGVEVPHWALHVPPLEVLQMGATIRRVQDSYAARLKGSGTAAGVIAATSGMIQKIPFADQPSRMAKSLANAESASKFAVELATSMAVPPDVGNIARLMDANEEGEPIPRKPETPGDMFKMQIPGLREEVPENTKKKKSDIKDKIIEGLKDGDPDAKEQLKEAKKEGVITEKDVKDMKEDAKDDPIVKNAKHMKLEVLAERLKKNANSEQRKLLLPVLKKKFFGQAGKDLDKDQKREYRDLIKEIKDE